MERSFLQRLLKPVADVRVEEATTALMMFAYSFLAMTSYNIIQPLTRSKLISSLGAVNIPYVLMGLGVASGILMVGYTRLYRALPRRWALPGMQAVMAAIMIGFWALFQTGREWVPVGFYIWGAIYSVLLISQFWTLANGIYDPRQAKRLFGFIGGGVMIGGLTGAAITAFLVLRVGSNSLILLSGFVLAACALLVTVIVGREKQALDTATIDRGRDERGVSLTRAFQLLVQSKQVQLIAVIIGFGSVGGSLIEQQLNMAAESLGQEEMIGEFLSWVRVYLGFATIVIQVWVTPRIHRYLGVGFALLLLPVSLGLTALGIVATAILWAPAIARISDQAIRYTIDKTTREVLFLPLPTALRQDVKPFVDVTVDRLSRGAGAILLLLLVQPWALGLQWHQLSYVSFGFMAVWLGMAVRAKREYLTAFRQGLERRDVQPAGLRLEAADLSTIETLMEELASPDERHVLYAIEILESLEKRNLITPLLLHHESEAVRARALYAIGGVKSELAERWLPSIQRMIADESAEVRAAAISALANIQNEQVTELVRPYLQHEDSRVVTTAAVVLARSGRDADVAAAEDVLSRFAADTRDSAAAARKDVAAALRQIADPRFRHMLVPLLHDANLDVAAEAMRSVRALGASDYLFVPTLVSLLRHRRLKAVARETLVSYGESVLDTLAYLLRDPGEEIWVRRHIPATIAQIGAQKSVDILIDALQEPDAFLRYKVVAGLEKLRRDHPELSFERQPIEALALKEALRYFNCLTLYYNLFVRAKLPGDALLADALQQKMTRTSDRVYRLLGLLYPWKDIAAARYTIEQGEGRSRAGAIEYMDNLLSVPLRKRLMPIIEDLPIDEKVSRANVALKSRPRDVEETLLQLINDDDQVVAAAAIDLVEERKIWTLAEDLEFVLAHRDAKDWYVFEAASWALAAHRLPEQKRRGLWVEPLPVVQLAARLRHVPVFASVSVDELFRMAGSGRQVRYESGRILYQEGAPPDQLQFLLDGTVTAQAAGTAPRRIAPPAPLAFEPILEGGLMPETIRTTDTAVCLALSREEMWTLISYNSELVPGLFRMLATGTQAGRPPVLAKQGAAADLARLSAGPLKPIEKILVLQRVPLFGKVAADEMRHLASIAHEVSMEESATLFTEADPPAVWMMLSGRLSVESPAGEAVALAEPGDLIGLHETLEGGRLGRRGVVQRAGRALRIEREELFDLLSQRPDLLAQIFSALFHVPLQADGRLAGVAAG